MLPLQRAYPNLGPYEREIRNEAKLLLKKIIDQVIIFYDLRTGDEKLSTNN